MKTPQEPKGIVSVRAMAGIAAICLLPVLLYAGAPAWWGTRNVTTGGTAHDYAAANVGQLKNIATAAYNELYANLPGGVGDMTAPSGTFPGGTGYQLTALVQSWSTVTGGTPVEITGSSTNDYAVVNMGQVKNVARLFYNRLIEVGYANQYPWETSPGFPSDYAVANIGQIKNLFSFSVTTIDSDGNGLPDTWEMEYFGHTGVNPNAIAPNGGGQTILYDFQNALSPLASGSGSSYVSGTANPGGGGETDGTWTVDGTMGVPVMDLSDLYCDGEWRYTDTDGYHQNFMVAEIDWTPNYDDSPIDHYLVEYKYDGGSWTVSGTTGDTYYDAGTIFSDDDEVDSGSLVAGVRYQFRVTAVDAAGDKGKPANISYNVPPIKKISAASLSYNEPLGDDDFDAIPIEYDFSSSTYPIFLDGPYSSTDYTAVTLALNAIYGRYEGYTNDDLSYDGAWDTSIPLKHLDGEDWNYEAYTPDDLQQILADKSIYIYRSGSSNDASSVLAEYERLTPLQYKIDFYPNINPYYSFNWVENYSSHPALSVVDEELDSGTYIATGSNYYTLDGTVSSSSGGSFNYLSFATSTENITSGTYELIPDYEHDFADDDGDFVSWWATGGTVNLIPPMRIKVYDGTNPTPGQGYYDESEESGTLPIGSGSYNFDIEGVMPGSTIYVGSGTGGTPNFLVYQSGTLVSPGSATINSGKGFTIVPNGASNGDTVFISVWTPTGPYEDTVQFAYYNPAQAPGSYTVPFEEASGARYRKIGLNGRPLSDEKPQHTAETDEEKEDTYIDALTLGLHHSTTDVYVPVPGSDLTLTARRDTASECWNMQSGLRPHERLDRPFGAGWTSNLTANLDVVQTVIATGSDSSVTQTYGYVTDQNGSSHRFMEASDGTFIPMPSDQRENGDYMTTLTLLGDGLTYMFSDRYGTQIIFQTSSVTPRTINTDRYKSTGTETHTQYGVNQIKDRLGYTLDYHYPTGSETLVPDTITLDGHADQVLSIRQNSTGQITDIWDPNGHHTQYGYTAETYTFAGGSYTEQTLTSVTAPDGGVTDYGYDCAMYDATSPTGNSPNLTAVEGDLTPPTVSQGETVNKYHLDVNEISDPLGNLYTFNYAFDQTKRDYSTTEGYFQETGAPRNVTQVQLPGSLGTTTLTNNSNVYLTYDGGTPLIGASSLRQTVVTDAVGQTITYTFGTETDMTQVFNVGGIDVDTPPAYVPKVVFYLDMKIDYGSLGSEYFTFDPTAGLALSTVTDFSGNTTTYTYGDAMSTPWVWASVFPYSGFFGSYPDPTQQTDALGNSKYFYYGVYQILDTEMNEDGNYLVYGLDGQGRRTSMLDYGYLKETDYTYGSAAYPGVVTSQEVVKLGYMDDPSWVVAMETDYTLDGDGRVSAETVVNPGGGGLTTNYTYDPDGSKLSATDPLGNETWFSYDAKERLTTVIHQDGSQKSFWYDARGNKTAEWDENGIATLYQYDALNRVTEQARDMNGDGVINTGDLITQYGYNAVNSKTSVIDPNGHTTTMTYDGLQRLLTVTDPLTHVTTYSYSGTNTGSGAFDSSGFKPSSVTDANGYTTTATYDKLYRPTVKSSVYFMSGTTILSSTTSMGYDNVGNVTSATDPLGHTTTTTYDTMNRVTQVTFADGKTNQFTYTSMGVKYKAVDESGVVAETEYDYAGRPVETIADVGGLNATTLTGYDAASNVTSTINPVGNEWDYQYDSRNRKIVELAPSVIEATTGMATRPMKTIQYDNVGNVVSAMDARLNRTDTVYDAANRPVETLQPPDPSGNRPTTTTSYDNNGSVLTLTDPDSHTTVNTYDAMNRLLTTTDAASNEVSYTYDPVGNRLTVTDGNSHVTHFAYDGLKRNTTIIDSGSNTTIFAYDALNKTSRTDALGQVTTYTYHSRRNRLTAVGYTSRTADNKTYSYDPVGNLLSVNVSGYSGAANVAYTYDNLRRVSTETSGGLTHDYSYDLAGNRLETVYGGTGRTIVSTYDALNRLSTMMESGTNVTTYGYDSDGGIVLKILPNGDKIWERFDALNRTLTQSSRSGANQSLYQYSYAYDLAGNVLTEGETYPSGLNNRTVTSTYDAIYRLLSEADTVSGTTTTTTYTYDAANNRLTKAISGGATTDYTYNSLNQLTAYSDGTTSGTLTYDADGSRTKKVVGSGTDAYSYDYENRLVGLAKGISGTGITTGTYAYTYDYRTRRVTRDESEASGVVTKVVYSGGSSVEELSGTATTPTVEYIRGSDYGGGIGGVLYTIRSGTSSYTHENRRGDVVAKTDGTGSLTYQAAYEAFGKRTQEQGSTLDRQKANTKDEDPTGLLNEGGRYRDLDTGEFITADPLGFVDGPNRYCYVNQNPWTSFDPEGLFLFGLFDSPGDYVHGVGDVWVGYGQAVVGTVTGVGHLVAHPIQSAEGIGTAIAHPVTTAKAVGTAISTSWNDGNQGKGLVVGNALIAVGTAAMPFAEASNVPKIAEAANLVSKTGDVADTAAAASKTGEVADTVAEVPKPHPDAPPEPSTTGEAQTPQERGLQSEQRVLKDTGNEKNTTTYPTSEGDTIPDFVNDTEVGDVKDTKNLSNTKQMKAQREVASQQGKDHVVYTGENTEVTQPMQNSGTKVIRRPDLGPQTNN